MSRSSSSSAVDTSVRRLGDEDFRCHVGLGVVGDEGGAFRLIRGCSEAGLDLPLEGVRVRWSTPRPFPVLRWDLLGVGVSDASVRAHSWLSRGSCGNVIRAQKMCAFH